MINGIAGLKSHHFLVAGDPPIVRNLVRATLSRLGARSLSFADSGEEAVRVLTRLGDSITFVLADWNMETLDGLQLLKKIRTGAIANIRREMPFIMLTSYSAEPIITAAANLDVSAFLVKPVSAQRLEEAVHFAISRPLTPKPASFYERIKTVSLPYFSDARDEATPTPSMANPDDAPSAIHSHTRGDAEE
jgi:CheY-like chemotaxis protein